MVRKPALATLSLLGWYLVNLGCEFRLLYFSVISYKLFVSKPKEDRFWDYWKLIVVEIGCSCLICCLVIVSLSCYLFVLVVFCLLVVISFLLSCLVLVECCSTCFD